MHIDDAVNARHAVLQPHPILHRAEIISEMQFSGRLNAGKNKRPVFGFTHDAF
jgi:hypothetical protein